MKRKQVTAACLMAATMLFSGCTPNISEYAARAQQAGKSFWEGETTDAMAQDSDAAAIADGETSEAGETQNVSTGTDTAAATNEWQDSAAATDDEIQGGTTATGGEAQHGDTAATADSEMPAAGETQTDTATESAAATAPQIPALMTEVTDSVYEAYAQKSDAFTGKLAGHDRLSRAENAALTAVLSQKEYGDKTLCLQNMAKYDSNANESFLLMFESTPLTARGRISGDLWYYDGESARLLEKGIVVTGLQQVTGIGNPFVILETEVSGKKQAAVWTVKDQKCEKLLEDAETIETTKDGVCTFYPAEKTVYDPLVSEWDSAEETVPVYYERTADGFAERSYRELTASEYLAYVSAEDSDEEAQAWKEKLEEQFYTQTDENTEYTYWFYAIGEDKIAYRCREAGQSVGQEEGIDHAVAKYSWCISSLDQGKLTKASETISGDGFFFPSRLEQEEALESLEDIPNEFTKNRLNKVQKTARATVGQAVAQILEVQEYPDDALCFAETADYDGNGKKETFAAIGRYDGAFGAPVCDLWFVGADGAVLEEENFAFKELEKLGSAFVLYRGYEVSGVSDMLFGVQEQGAVRLLKQMGHFELDDDGRIRQLRINPEDEGVQNLSMNIYIIEREFLVHMISEAYSKGMVYFDRDLLAPNLERLNVRGFEFNGYLARISDIKSYFDENMKLLKDENLDGLFGGNPIYTKIRDDNPTRYIQGSKAKNIMSADGCIIEGEVENSILFRGVRIAKGAKVKNCVLMQDTIVGEGANVEYVITDKNVTISAGKEIKGADSFPVYVAKYRSV